MTVIFNEIIPATAESAAPTANAIPLEEPMKKPITTDRPIATGIITFISLARNAEAPSFTASEIARISFVPGFCLVTQAAKPAATAKEAITAIIGKS